MQVCHYRYDIDVRDSALIPRYIDCGSNSSPETALYLFCLAGSIRIYTYLCTCTRTHVHVHVHVHNCGQAQQLPSTLSFLCFTDASISFRFLLLGQQQHEL